MLYCNNCGKELDSFTVVCPACGCEIRDKKATDSVKEFYSDLLIARTTNEKAYLIRSYPIPNAKEDILEFMILACSNIPGEENQNIYEAWLVKAQQAYQKAKLLFGQDSDFAKIQQIYDNCIESIDAENRQEMNKYILETVIRNGISCVGIFILVVAVIMDRTGGNASLMEIVGGIVLIAFAAGLNKRKAFFIDYIVSAVCGLLMLWLASMFHNGALVQLCAGVELIIAAIQYFKSRKQSVK